MILSFWTDRSGQTVQKQIRVLEELSDQVHCLLYEPRYEKTGFLHMRKQRRRSASR